MRGVASVVGAHQYVQNNAHSTPHVGIRTMNTTLRTKDCDCGSSARMTSTRCWAIQTCSKSSADVNCRCSPSVPVAQKVHARAHPTCDETHTVYRGCCCCCCCTVVDDELWRRLVSCRMSTVSTRSGDDDDLPAPVNCNTNFSPPERLG